MYIGIGVYLSAAMDGKRQAPVAQGDSFWRFTFGSACGGLDRETTGPPTFLGNPCAYALLYDPGRIGVPGHSVRQRGPRSLQDEGSGIGYFEAQSHGLGTRGLRFAGWIAPPPRKTRFWSPAKLCQTGFHPQGSTDPPPADQ